MGTINKCTLKCQHEDEVGQYTCKVMQTETGVLQKCNVSKKKEVKKFLYVVLSYEPNLRCQLFPTSALDQTEHHWTLSGKKEKEREGQ